VNTVQAANTVMAASQATAVANSEKKSDPKDNATKLGEKIEELGKILAKHLPTFQSKDGAKKANAAPASSATSPTTQQAVKAGKRAVQALDMEKRAATVLPAGPSVPALPESVKSGIVQAGEAAKVVGETGIGGVDGSATTAGAAEVAETALAAAGEAETGGAGVSAEAAAQTEAAAAKAAEVEAKLPNLSEQMLELSGMYKSFISENEAVSNFINDNWSFFGSIYEGASAAIQAYNALQLISKTYTFLNSLGLYAQAVAAAYAEKGWHGLNTAMKANVIMFIVTLIAGLATALITLYKQNDTFTIGILKMWHSFLLFFLELPINFWAVVEGVLEAFLFLYKKMSTIIDNLVNGIIQGLGGLLKFFGYEIDFNFKLNMGKALDVALENVREKKIAAKLVYEKQDKEFADYRENLLAERAAKRAADEIEQEQKVTGLPTESSASNNVLAEQNAVAVSGGRLDEVGKINDTVDISSEDIKMMRELAEMKNIQNFVTLQPSVNVQTGDIRNGMDVGSMVEAITTMLQDEISSSAEGVYR
jgi:hypothetical protein